jgi:hypothetical protein
MTPYPRVVEAGLRSFTCAYDRYVESPLRLGQFVAVREGPVTVLGVVADAASGPEDPARPLQPAGGTHSAAQVFADNPHILPLLRTRVSVVSCGHASGEAVLPLLPPSPPPLLALVQDAVREEVSPLAADGAFLSLLVASPLADDQVIAAAIRFAARAFDLAAHEFTVAAGKELARLLRAEPARLATVLRSVSA